MFEAEPDGLKMQKFEFERRRESRKVVELNYKSCRSLEKGRRDALGDTSRRDPLIR